MTPVDSSTSFTSLFTAYFGQLVFLLRRQPGNIPAQKTALRSAMAVLPRSAVVLEAGIEYSDVPDDSSLKGRLLLRHIDAIHFAHEASAGEVLALARALASDHDPIPSTAAVLVDLLPSSGVRGDLEPASAAPMAIPAPREPEPPPVQRHRTMAGPVDESERLARALERFAAEGLWMESLHASQALVRLTARFPEHEQRAHVIAVRRVLTRELLDEYVNFALRTQEEQGRVAEVLQHAGPEGIELMVDHICRSESAGPRKFIHDLLAATPAALPMLLPLLQSSRWHEVRHGAELLGRLNHPDAIGPLRQALEHPDPRVRSAVIDALARFQGSGVLEPIRRALGDPAPATRVSAAHALARRNAPGLALPILVALESEKDPQAWLALMSALVETESAEALSALALMAVERKSLLKAGRPMSQRLAIIKALGQADTAGRRRALERIAAEGDAQLRRAAEDALAYRR